MSQSTAMRSTARAPRPGPRVQPPRPAGPRLRVVTAPRHTRSRASLVAACVALLVLGLVGLLLLNVSLERGTYDLRDQASRAEQLREQTQRLEMELRALQSPANLYNHSRGLGMVDGPASPVFRKGGATLGVPTPAPTPPRPTVTQQASRSVTSGAPSATSSGRSSGAATARPAPTATTAPQP
jgi:hypothetical protein